MNNVNLIGRICNDIEVRQTQNGVAVVSFNLAINNKVKDKEFTDYIPCVIWREYATRLAPYLIKGKQIGVTGSLHSRTYEDKQKVKHYVTEVHVSEVTFVGKKETDQAQDSTEPPAPDMENVNEEGMPF